MTISGLAVFTNVLTVAEMNNYVWPTDYIRDNIVKRADGTVYHGNDENRAIITNWQCQITRPAAPPAPNTIDILYVLDKPSREYIEETKNTSLDEFFARETAFMNEMLCRTDMDTNFWFRMVGVYPLDVQAQEVSPMLGRCKNSSEPGFELVNEVRNRVGADIVFSVARNGGGIGGLAYVNSYENIVSGAAAPLGHACGFLDYYDMISWIHEIAHVMSCNHMPPANIDVNNPRHRQFGVVVHDDNATEAPFDYRTIMTGYYYAGQTWCFSSRNHYYNGVQLSVSNHVDATQVMVELAPYVAQWRPTKVPERPEISFFPQNYAEIPVGVETTVTIDYGDPDAEIYWYDATSGEGKSDAHPYTGPISVTGGSRNTLYAFAKTNGVEVAGTEKTATYFPTGTYGRFDYSVVLDSEGVAWSMPLADSSEFAWDKDTQIFCAGESSYQAHVDMESLTNSRPSTCSATAMLTLTEAKNLNFRHRDSYTNAMFSVWVDNVPVYYKNGASDTSGEWRKEVVRIEPGTHRIEFIFTQTAEDRIDAQTSEDDDHALVDDEKYQRYIASLVAAETSRVWIDGLEWTPADLIWAGDEMTGDGVWSTDTSYTPWEGGVPFADDAVTTFPDLAAGSATVTVKGEVRPGKVNFTGVKTAYTIVPEDDNAFVYISNGSSIEFKTNATIRVPFRLDAAHIRSAASRTLELGNIFGNNLSGPGNQGAFSGQIGVNSQSTVIMNPGAGRTQTVGDFGKNWSYTNSDLVFTNGTVKVNGAINGGAGLFQYKRIHVKDGAVLELVTNDATGYDVAGNNTIEVERGGELKIDAGDRLRRPMKLSGGTLTVSRSGSVHALALYNNPSFTVTADSVLTNGNASASLGFVGQDATITLQNNATLDCYVPFLSGRMSDDGKSVTIAGNGTFVQNEVMMQFTNKVTVANGVTFRQNALVFGTVGSWDVNGTLEANAIMQMKALTLASGATLAVKVTDANISNAAIMCDATPSLAGAIRVDAASDLENGKYAVISATGLDDGVLERVSAPTLAKRATFAVEEGGLFMTVADYVDDATTDTNYPVPYSWMMNYYPDLRGDTPENTEQRALQLAANATNAVWECYVLGLDPTNEASRFTASVRFQGDTPVIAYWPTNDTLVASGTITNILQGWRSDEASWTDCESFSDLGDNTQFRVKVSWANNGNNYSIWGDTIAMPQIAEARQCEEWFKEDFATYKDGSYTKGNYSDFKTAATVAGGLLTVDVEHNAPPLYYEVPSTNHAKTTSYTITAVIKELVVNASTDALPVYTDPNPYASIAAVGTDWYVWNGSGWVLMDNNNTPEPLDGSTYTNAVELSISNSALKVKYFVNGNDLGTINRASANELPTLAWLGFSGYGKFESFSGVESLTIKAAVSDSDLVAAGIDMDKYGTVEEALVDKGANDLYNWQNLILGIRGDEKDTKPYIAPVQNAEPGQLSFSVGNYTPNNNLVGKTAKFTVYEVDENGNEVETEGKLASEETDLGKSATIPTTDIGGVRYFKIRIKFE